MWMMKDVSLAVAELFKKELKMDLIKENWEILYIKRTMFHPEQLLSGRSLQRVNNVYGA